jgi:von Willebrand factor type A C-terminal domain/von Willebrand factor type A domain
MDFNLESHYTPHLSPDSTQVDAIVSVSLSGDATTTRGSQQRVLGFIADRSGSMNGLGRIQAVNGALAAAIDALDSDSTFFVVAFDFEAEVISAPVLATPANKQLARERVLQLRASGGTAMSTGLEMALAFFRRFPQAINRALFLTDGRNESERIDKVRRVLAECNGAFECDCWGLGTDWQVGEVQEIARELNGKAALLPDRDSVEAAFRTFVENAQSKAIRSASLRLWAPQGAQIVQVRQMNPTIEELAGRAQPVTALVSDFPTGAWAPGEARDYFVSIRVQPGGIGDELLACRPSLTYVDSTGQQQEIKAPEARIITTWTADDRLTSRIDPTVAHYTGQEEMAQAIQHGLEASERGNVAQATQLLGRAVQLAHQSGNAEMTSRLRRVVEIDDAASGTVRVKRSVEKAASMDLELESTTTKRAARKQPV